LKNIQKVPNVYEEFVVLTWGLMTFHTLCSRHEVVKMDLTEKISCPFLKATAYLGRRVWS
jgi:hypothetical protein